MVTKGGRSQRKSTGFNWHCVVNWTTKVRKWCRIEKNFMPKAAQLSAEHQAKSCPFHTNTQMRKAVATEASEKATTHLAATMKELNVKKLAEAEREACATHVAEREQNHNQTTPPPALSALEVAVLDSWENRKCSGTRTFNFICNMKGYHLRGLTWLV